MSGEDARRSPAFGGALAVGVLIALGFLAARAFPGGQRAPRAATLAVPVEEEVPDAGETFVPDLPAVPDLAADRAARAAAPPSDATEAPEPASEELAQEMRLVHEARMHLDEDPNDALALLDQHRARFPEGALAEEREAYAILAMIMLGSPAGEVERRFLELTADHPETSFAPAIREAIARRAEQEQAEAERALRGARAVRGARAE